jgi:hypothetical protein
VCQDKKLYCLLALVIACFLLACKPQSPATAASDVKSQLVAYPTTLADMSGWHGIQVTQTPSNGRMNCGISFPPSFGMLEEERSLLIFMVAQRVAVRSKANCFISPDDVYQALKQLLRLVFDKQDPVAARLLLYRGTMDMPFNLDGEVLEGYTESYLVPVLEKYEKLDTVLDQSQESLIAKSICADLKWRVDIKDPVFKNRIQVLVRRLNAKGMKRFASEIESCDLSHPPGQ